MRLNQSVERDDSLAQIVGADAVIPLDEISELSFMWRQGRTLWQQRQTPGAVRGDLGSLPMVDYAIDRLPITLELLISANRNIEQYLLRGKVIKDSDCNLLGRPP